LASTFATELFIPFVKYFVYSGGSNPYTHFFELGKLNIFPYPSLMLFILSSVYAFFGFIFGTVSNSLTHADLFMLRIPLLFADIGILVILLSWFKKQTKEVLWLYWMSPVLMYISYVHGQLDAIPIFFLFVFLYFLFKEYDIAALLSLGLAISTKTGMLVVLPFVLLYLLKERKGWYMSFLKVCIPIVVFVIFNYQYLQSKGFIEIVLKTKEEFKVFDLVVSYTPSLVLYVIPVIFVVLLFRFYTFKRYSRNLFMVFLGFSFFALTLCIPPMQGWYFWVIPFAIYFYVQANTEERLLLYVLSAAYFIYFACIEKSDYFAVFAASSDTISALPNLYAFATHHGIAMSRVINVAFTFLQGVLLLNMYFIYRKGIEQYTKYKMYYKPFLIGVSGDSGSGKTTLAQLMEDVFAPRNVSIVAGDDMHKWERGHDMWQKYTHLDPMANDLHTDINHVHYIKNGGSVMRKHYDHSTGTFTELKKYEAKRLVIFEGLHTLFLDKVRKAFDIKIFVNPEEQLRTHWKIIRDKSTRGYSKEAILKQLTKRQDDATKYISVQEKYSDIAISLYNSTSLGASIGDEHVILDISLLITCANDIFLQPLLDELAKDVRIDYLMKDEKQTIKFTGTIDASRVQDIAQIVLPELDELSIEHRRWHDSYNGIIQLVLSLYMFESMKLEHHGI
jgi:uridine kinase/Gpi18-like mannosyltransferase